uniref:Uncharacterized protein n=1 Tax=Rhizophora mucronata TaxID=61149 RepID=A0A2P2N0L2_RHIMU
MAAKTRINPINGKSRELGMARNRRPSP